MKTSIVFTGDIGFDRYMDGKWADENLVDQEILDFFNKNYYPLMILDSISNDSYKWVEGNFPWCRR